MKNKGLGHMHWIPGFLLSFLLKVLFHDVVNYRLPDAVSGFSLVARANIGIFAVLVMLLAVDALWYLLTFLRYYDSTVYVGFSILRMLYHIGDVLGMLIKMYSIYSREQIVLLGLLTLASNILLFVFFFKRSLRKAAEAEVSSEETAQ